MDTYCCCRLGNLPQFVQFHLEFVYSIVQRFNDHLIFSLDSSQLTPQLVHLPRQTLNLLIPGYDKPSALLNISIAVCTLRATKS